MVDVILKTRIDALVRNLDRLTTTMDVIHETKWLQSPFRTQVRNDVENDVGDRKAELEELLERVDKANGAGAAEELCVVWRRFGEIEADTRELFTGCLELIGGTAFREKRQEERVWTVADAATGEIAQSVVGNQNYVTVPGMQEALCDSRGRTIRLLFPEWTVWSLPLVAYEFGHVAITRRPRLGEILREQRERLLGADDGLAKLLADEGDDAGGERHERDARERHARRVRVLLADAFATFTMGPAYVLAAFHLRLDPATHGGPEPTAAERARVMIACLRAIDAGAADDTSQAASIERLETEWRQTLDHAGVGPLDDAREGDLETKLIPALAGAFGALRVAARFNRDRWFRAVALKNQWEQVIDAPRAASSSSTRRSRSPICSTRRGCSGAPAPTWPRRRRGSSSATCSTRASG